MIEVRFGPEHTDFDRVHAWLSESYWSPDVPRDRVERAAAHSSLVLNAFLEGDQVGYCRLVSDRTTFAWVSDVIVDPDHRGVGVAKALIEAAIRHPEFQGLRRWVLATRDAHSLYEKFGFAELPYPERWMVMFPEPRGPMDV